MSANGPGGPVGPILVGVDFSPESDRAVRHGLDLARHRGAELVLAHATTVPERPALLSEAPSTLVQYYARLEEDLERDRDRLEELRESISGQGATVSHVVVDGFPDTTLVETARELGAETIVLGTHGRSGVKWLLLGSVAQRVVRLAERNVLIARGDAPAGGYRRVLVATDFSAAADRALDDAIAFAGKGARLDVVHFWSLPAPVGPAAPFLPIDDLRRSVELQLKQRGASLLARHGRPDLEVRFQSVMAPVLPGLVDRIEAEGHDLAVVGSHGRRGLRRFVLGSVAEGVVQKSPCSVLVVHRT